MSGEMTFINHGKSLIATMKNMGNPLSDSSGDLLVLYTWVVADTTVIKSIRRIEKLRVDQCKEFFKTKLVDQTATQAEIVPKNKLRLFSWHPEKGKSAQRKS